MVRNIVDSTGRRNSVYPCTEGLTFYPFIYMVPQYRPDTVLMLGFAGGTVAGLIRLIHGDVRIVGVDIGYVENLYGVEIVGADAREYVRGAEKFDAVIIDVYEDGQYVPCDFVTDADFVADVKEIANYVIVHAKVSTDMREWGRPLKVLELNDSRFYYYVINRIAQLPIR